MSSVMDKNTGEEINVTCMKILRRGHFYLVAKWKGFHEQSAGTTILLDASRNYAEQLAAQLAATIIQFQLPARLARERAKAGAAP
jgi:hypothetical protein